MIQIVALISFFETKTALQSETVRMSGYFPFLCMEDIDVCVNISYFKNKCNCQLSVENTMYSLVQKSFGLR